MKHWPWRSIALLAATMLVVAAFLVPDPTAQDLSSLSSHELVQLLSSPREVVRRAAAGQLIVRAKTVVPELVSTALRAGADHLQEIMAILEELMLSSDQQVADLAESALEQLAAADNRSVVDLATRVLLRNSTLRHTRALAHVEMLGGNVLVLSNYEDSTAEPQDDPALATPRNRPSSRLVVLDQNWQGGDAGLKYVARLFPREAMSLHLTDDAPVTAAAVQQLRAQREHTVLRRPSQGCLGVSYREDASELVINGVIPGSPADRAGLRPGDVVLLLNGEPLQRFSQLATWAREQRPGDLVELKLQRRSTTVRVRFPLGTDFGTGVCRCVDGE